MHLHDYCHLKITKQMCATTGSGWRYIFQLPLNANDKEISLKCERELQKPVLIQYGGE